ncbi:hypothetical protein D9756_009342 [Leucocoprinus leucothites]|uniref:Uncharacterized protein n=1 Tax=Leucocoprinus leucothites TaxID=201217 RepID=A0A8H5FTM9_9AGAR|nr:hypothetical protein D9756_009342 [Leucoagaricus leucothites]
MSNLQVPLSAVYDFAVKTAINFSARSTSDERTLTAGEVLELLPPGLFCFCTTIGAIRQGDDPAFWQFYMTPNSENRNGVKWKIQLGLGDGRRGVQIIKTENAKKTSVSAVSGILGIFVLKRGEVKPGTPQGSVERAELTKMQTSIQTAFERAKTKADKVPVENRMKMFLEFPFRELANEKVIGLPWKKIENKK